MMDTTYQDGRHYALVECGDCVGADEVGRVGVYQINVGWLAMANTLDEAIADWRNMGEDCGIDHLVDPTIAEDGDCVAAIVAAKRATHTAREQAISQAVADIGACAADVIGTIDVFGEVVTRAEYERGLRQQVDNLATLLGMTDAEFEALG